MNNSIDSDDFARKEDEQIINLLEENFAMIKKKNDQLSNENLAMKTMARNEHKQSIELEQTNMFVEQTSQDVGKILKKKYIAALAITLIVFAAYSVIFSEPVGIEYKVVSTPKTSGYTIENLRGDTIDTFISWKIVEGESIKVNILNSENFDPQIIDAVKKSIISNEIIEIDNSLLHKGPKGTTSEMYIGWQGAMNSAAKADTQFIIPTNFEIIESTNGIGDITIELTNKANGDGFAGWTNIIADESENQILKSRITIFDIDKISTNSIETIVRHEMGHALGLIHSTAPEDLMYPTIETNFPYISECDIDAMQNLYNGDYEGVTTCRM